MTEGRTAVTEKEWSHFAKAYRRERNEPDGSRVIDLLAVLSHASAFAVGCYCEDERHCHCGILRDLLDERGAMISDN